MDLHLLKKKSHLGQSIRKYLSEQQPPYFLLSDFINGLIKNYPDEINSVQALEFLRNNINNTPSPSIIEDCVRNTSCNIQNELIIHELLSFINIDYVIDANVVVDNLRNDLMKEINEVKKHSIELGNELLELKEHFLNKQI